MKDSKLKVIIYFIALVTTIVIASLAITSTFKGVVEKETEKKQIVVREDMKISDIARENEIKIDLVKEALNIKSEGDAGKTLKEIGTLESEALDRINKQVNYAAEEASKNPVVIISKFIIWIVLMVIAFNLLRKNELSPTKRKVLLLLSIFMTGVILGSEPNTMSTVKDMISAYIIKGIVFPPRLIAMTLLLVVVVLANKIVCGFACQFGTLQDLIFRINRDKDDKQGIFKQYKVPFVVSNTIRIAFFVAFILIATFLTFDIVEEINPFKIFNATKLTLITVISISSILLVSLFVYRPWCHFFCPFGLVSWMLEKFSRYKVKVDYKTCTSCYKCSKICPSNVMDAILKQNKKVTPDCFACGSCLNVCPTKSICFDKGDRMTVPKGKFEKVLKK